MNVNNLNNVICETSRTSKNKKRKYPKDKINELEGNIRTKTLETYTAA
jgi:hypothetical protein